MDENVPPLSAEESNSVDDPQTRPLLTVLLAIVVGLAYLAVQILVVIGLLVLELTRNPNLDIDAWADQAVSNGTILSIATSLAALITVPLMIGFTALLVRRQQRSAPIRQFLLLRWPGAKSLAIWLSAVSIYVFAADWFMLLSGHDMTAEFMIEAYRTADSVALLWVALLVAAPVTEELFFRGFLFRGLMSTRLRWWGAAIITSLAWTLIHVQYNWQTMLVIFLGGLLLAAARQSSQSVVTCILMHTVWNFVAMFQTMLIVGRGA